MEIYSKGTLELELHTYQKDARISFKKVVDLYVDLVRPFPTKMSTIFWGGNIVNFFNTKILVVLAANAQCVKIYRKGAPVLLHTHQKNAWIYLKEVD